MKPKRLPTRFFISQVVRNDKELILHLMETFSINETAGTFKCILRDFWCNLIVEVGESISIFDPKIESNFTEDVDSTILIIDNANGLVVVKPDVLLSITTLMTASYCMRKAWLSRTFEVFGEPSKALLVGTIIHEIFQESLRRKEYTIPQIQNIFYTKVINNFTLDLYSLNMNQEDLIAEIKPYFSSISHWLQLYTDKNANGNTLFVIQRLHDIENTIWSTKYGLIGKVDLTLEAMFEDKVNMSKTINLIPLELKTGRHTFSPAHIGQVILYSFIMSDKYINHKSFGGFLLYLKDEVKTEHIKTNHNVFRDLILLRNRFIRYYDKLGFIDDKDKDKLILKGPETFNSERICSKCEHNLDCSLIYKCFDVSPFDNPNDSHYSTIVTSHLKTNEMEFFSNMVSLLEIEKQYCLASEKFVSFWNFRSEECETSGIGLSKMKIKYQDKRTIVFNRNPKAISMPKKLFALNSDLNINLSLLEDRRVVISEEMISSKKTFEIYGNFCKQLCIAIGQINSFSENTSDIVIYLEKDQINLLNPTAAYRIDFLKNLSTKATLINFSNLLRLMSKDDPRAAELREIVIHGRIPKFNLNDSKFSSFSQFLNSPILSKLNIQQKRCVLGILKTKCSLIFGSPGSGKTQTIVALIQILVQLGYSVLVTSYTHVAVDNILLKLVKANLENCKNVDFMRIGSIKRIHPQFLDYSDYHRTKTWLKNGDLNSLNNFYATIPVVASTCLGIFNHPLFSKRTFDFCIIDEASQVFLSTSLGPLFNCRNFVLVGDQKQLPPVVQSPYARKNGLNESLFARLLNIAGKQDVLLYDDLTQDFDLENFGNNKKYYNTVDLKSLRIFPLFIQYRMNGVIMEVANKLTYARKLKCASKEVESISMLDYLPDDKRVIFDEYQQSYLSKVISPCLQDSVVFIDTGAIEQAFEICSNDGLSQKSNIDTPNMPDYPQFGFVYNDFEAQLIIRIVQTLLLAYNKKTFKVDNIGIISPFRQQVTRIRELFGSHFLEQNNLEINTVDQYQGRDKEVIIYSCVKSCATLEDSHEPGNESLLPIIDSELLKDERRLNVAITRAKRKLIIVGNRATLTRYLPFRNLFNILETDQFIKLVNYDYGDITDLL